MAYVPDEQNEEMLIRVLQSVRCHHPRDHVLVVDNDSPGRLVGRAAQKITNLTSEYALKLGEADPMVDAGNVTMGNVIVMRKTPGLAILSAWAAADEVLRHPARHGLPVDVARVIFLQHSTALCRPVKAVSANPDCPAVSLTGFIPMGGTGHMFRRAHFVERLGIISLIAEAVGIACSEPCQRQVQRAAKPVLL